MNKKIKELTTKLDGLNSAYNQERHVLRDVLQKEYNKVFDRDKALAKALQDLESASLYSSDESGIYRWFRFSGLDDIAEDTREYFEAWLSEHCTSVNWVEAVLMDYEGECITIQDDTRRDNGVWVNGKCIIDESAYKTDGEIDVKLRNELIEAYMEKEGYFPGVFRVTQYGDIFPVSTLPEKKA